MIAGVCSYGLPSGSGVWFAWRDIEQDRVWAEHHHQVLVHEYSISIIQSRFVRFDIFPLSVPIHMTFARWPLQAEWHRSTLGKGVSM